MHPLEAQLQFEKNGWLKHFHAVAARPQGSKGGAARPTALLFKPDD
jgi:hypothetical protein